MLRPSGTDRSAVRVTGCALTEILVRHQKRTPCRERAEELTVNVPIRTCSVVSIVRTAQRHAPGHSGAGHRAPHQNASCPGCRVAQTPPPGPIGSRQRAWIGGRAVPRTVGSLRQRALDRDDYHPGRTRRTCASCQEKCRIMRALLPVSGSRFAPGEGRSRKRIAIYGSGRPARCVKRGQRYQDSCSRPGQIGAMPSFAEPHHREVPLRGSRGRLRFMGGQAWARRRREDCGAIEQSRKIARPFWRSDHRVGPDRMHEGIFSVLQMAKNLSRPGTGLGMPAAVLLPEDRSGRRAALDRELRRAWAK